MNLINLNANNTPDLDHGLTWSQIRARDAQRVRAQIAERNRHSAGARALLVVIMLACVGISAAAIVTTVIARCQ